ncbi:MAG TPA: ATP-binding protein [Acidimicrobiia bacterium]|nr:ATP-binding protein [Acidimicrobiia bacterium]
MTVVLVLGVLGFLVERSARQALLGEVENGVTQQAMAVAGLVPDSDVQAFVDAVAANIDARVTLIDGTGTVVGDSLRDPESLADHSDRPEVRAALAGSVGTDTRLSESTGFRQFYVAVPTGTGMVLRLSLPENAVELRLTALRRNLITVVGLAAAAGVVVVALVARRLARPLTRLAEMASAVAAGDLEVEVPRSSVEELDRLGTSIGEMANELGHRLEEVEGERRTLGVVLDALPQGTLLVGADDRVLYANRSLGALLGPIPDRLDMVVPFRIQEMVRRARELGEVVDVDLDHGRPVRVLRVIVSPFEDDRVLAVVGDITDRRRLDDVRRDFVTNASHELKTPVASILASAETIQIALEKAPERVPQFANQIEQAARTLSRMISDLLDLSRVEGGVPEFKMVDLSTVVSEILDVLAGLAEQRGVRLRSEVQPVSVQGSASDLSQVVRNLVDNAVRYTDRGGEVLVRLEERAGVAVLTVTDTGTGIPQRDLDRIFERFYRVDVARSRATGGTGLGLSIVRHVAEAHGGSVSVESQLGSGSTFTLRLPLPD